MEKNISESKVNFIMDTDWLFQEPIDFEHKKYILLGYFKKIDDILNQNKIYPTFIELSLHLASLQTILKENVILYTDKKFQSFDDEVLLKELSAKIPPNLKEDEIDEVNRIIRFSASKFFEYFSIFKSYWEVIYETISITLKRNKKYLRSSSGYMTYYNKKNDVVFVWEYNINRLSDKVDDHNSVLKLIYEGGKKELTLNQIIDNFSTFDDKNKKISPVFEMKAPEEYPLNETLVPLFKRKIMTYIFQSIRIEDLKTF
jgi:hypothetical protein